MFPLLMIGDVYLDFRNATISKPHAIHIMPNRHSTFYDHLNMITKKMQPHISSIHMFILCIFGQCPCYLVVSSLHPLRTHVYLLWY